MLRWALKRLNLGQAVRDRNGQKLQSRVDFIQVCALMDVYEACREGQIAPDEVEDKWQASLTRWESEPSIAALTAHANDGMIAQITEQFAHLHDLDSGAVPVPATLPDLHAASGSTAASEATVGPSTFTNPLPTAAFALSALAADDAETAVRDVKDSLLRRVGFAPWIGPTQAPTPDHSAGLFLKGAALPGTVVALYPGATFAIDMRMRASDVGHWMDPRVNRTIVPRHDGAVLDVDAFRPERPNPFAVAQHARHPPPDVRPNCCRIQVDFVLDSRNTTRLLGMPDYLSPFLPVDWGAKVSQAQALHNALDPPDHRSGVALVALREVYDEELFVDHRINPYRPQPAGYIPHDIGAAERTWCRWVDSTRVSDGRTRWEQFVKDSGTLPAGAGADEAPFGALGPGSGSASDDGAASGRR